MLFPYVYVPHQMEKMQEFIDFIFFEVWCKAPIGLKFHPDLFNKSPDLESIMSEFGFSSKAAARGKKFYKETKEIYDSFAALSGAEINQLKVWYRGNNDLEKACANDPATKIVRYADIASLHEDLGNKLKLFFMGLYSIDLAALRDKIGQIDDHYQAFVSKNKIGKCPFCGISPIKGIYHTRREAYDHYLPKSLYPFNSINFRNLAPACNDCNSSYKLSKDPLHGQSGRRKSFYPFATGGPSVQILITLLKSDIGALDRGGIALEFGPAVIGEELETWNELYEISDRYKAKICEDNDGKYWLTQALDEAPKRGLSPAEYLKDIEQLMKSNPYAECNFLKKPFLDACQKSGLF